MFNFFAHCENNLGRAGWLLLLEILGGVALGVSLAEFGIPAEFAMLAVWLVNFVTAWLLAKAARALGKSRILYGLFSALGPPAAVVSFFSLHNQDAMTRLARSTRAADEA